MPSDENEFDPAEYYATVETPGHREAVYRSDPEPLVDLTALARSPFVFNTHDYETLRVDHTIDTDRLERLFARLPSLRSDESFEVLSAATGRVKLLGATGRGSGGETRRVEMDGSVMVAKLVHITSTRNTSIADFFGEVIVHNYVASVSQSLPEDDRVARVPMLRRIFRTMDPRTQRRYGVIVMDRLEINGHELIRDGTLNHVQRSVTAALMFYQVATLFSKLETKGVRLNHRDLKLNNVMVEYEGPRRMCNMRRFHTYLIDFGMARAMVQTKQGRPLLFATRSDMYGRGGHRYNEARDLAFLAFQIRSSLDCAESDGGKCPRLVRELDGILSKITRCSSVSFTRKLSTNSDLVDLYKELDDVDAHPILTNDRIRAIMKLCMYMMAPDCSDANAANPDVVAKAKHAADRLCHVFTSENAPSFQDDDAGIYSAIEPDEKKKRASPKRASPKRASPSIIKKAMEEKRAALVAFTRHTHAGLKAAKTRQKRSPKSNAANVDTTPVKIVGLAHPHVIHSLLQKTRTSIDKPMPNPSRPKSPSKSKIVLLKRPSPPRSRAAALETPPPKVAAVIRRGATAADLARAVAARSKAATAAKSPPPSESRGAMPKIPRFVSGDSSTLGRAPTLLGARGVPYHS